MVAYTQNPDRDAALAVMSPSQTRITLATEQFHANRTLYLANAGVVETRVRLANEAAQGITGQDIDWKAKALEAPKR